MGGSLVALRNIVKAWLLLLATVALMGAIGWLIGGVQGLEIFVFCALLLAVAGYVYADRAVLGLTGARELPLGEAPTLHATVARLAGLARVEAPKLYVLPDAYPRAFATGRGPRSSALAVSSGLVAVCAPAELEGVLAHELAHVRHRDVLITSTVVLAGAALVEGSLAGGFLSRALLFVLAPVAAATEHLFLSPKREFEADRAAAALLGSPHGLADALLRLEQAGGLVAFEASPATEPLYTVNPFADEGLARMFVTHPPLGERVSRLRGLDPEWRDKLRAA